MTVRRMLLYDIPDESQLIGQYLDEIRDQYPETSWIALLSEIMNVERHGPVFADCKVVAAGVWHLAVHIGFGDIANIIYCSLKSEDYLALHGFTSKSGTDADRKDIAVALLR